MSAPRYDFSTRVALVTGAGSGIGRAAARGFGRAGARVVVADIDARNGELVAAEIRADGSEALFIRVDVTDEASVEGLVGATLRNFGALDFAFNNAGVEGRSGASTVEVEHDEWTRILRVNLTGVWLCMKYELLHMLERGTGCIVNTSSVAGVNPSVSSGVAYAASKHGVVGLTRTAHREFASSDIRINAICPGPVDTPLLGRLIGQDMVTAMSSTNGALARPEEIAESVLWLCSDGASFISGQVLVIDRDRIGEPNRSRS